MSNTDIYFTSAQASTLLDACCDRDCYVGKTTQEMVAKLLPVMASTVDAVRLLEKYLVLDDRVRLREVMGHALFDTCVGCVVGHYCLTLHLDEHQAALRKLAEISNDQQALGKASGRADTSQKGNWQCIRNEILDNKPIAPTHTL